MRYSNSYIDSFRKTGIIGRHDLPPLERFFAQIIVVESGCWIWQGGRTIKENGYGRLRVDGKKVVAHKFSFETFVRPVPEGLTLDHWCRVRLCVNPFHLRPIPFLVNVLLGVGPSALNAHMDVCSKGHEFSTRFVNCHGRRIIQRWCRVCTKGRQVRYQ